MEYFLTATASSGSWQKKREAGVSVYSLIGAIKENEGNRLFFLNVVLLSLSILDWDWFLLKGYFPDWTLLIQFGTNSHWHNCIKLINNCGYCLQIVIYSMGNVRGDDGQNDQNAPPLLTCHTCLSPSSRESAGTEGSSSWISVCSRPDSLANL